MKNQEKICEVIPRLKVNKGFDFLLPAEMQANIGQIVKVPFAGKSEVGVISAFKNASEHKNLKTISELVELPEMPDLLMKFLERVAKYNMAAIGAVVAMALPISKLPKKKIIEEIMPAEAVELSGDQERAYKEIITEDFSPTLLDGVTGSGKTEVYLSAIEKILKGDSAAQALVLLPEIALTRQLFERIRERFGKAPILWHSILTPAQRIRNFHEIVHGRAQLVIGARSALFLPYKNLKIMAVDEEHDGSYKQEEGVIYQARDMAVLRASLEKIPIILASATPSMETIYNVESGKYKKVTLAKRYAKAQLPTISAIDMRLDKISGQNFISLQLRSEIEKTIARGQQAMLYLNRRGYSPLTICSGCGYRYKCPNCSSWLVMHGGIKASSAKKKIPGEQLSFADAEAKTSTPYLQCHHCGYRAKKQNNCPECKTENAQMPLGPGVERIAEEIKNFMPAARIALVTSDEIATPKQLEELLEKIHTQQIDILIGTQMLAKGHNFPNLTLVGVVDADAGMEGGDPRAAERCFQLLQQVSGRAGRDKLPGQVFLQSYDPENPLIQNLLMNDRDKFIENEIITRKAYGLPPYGKLAALVVSGKNEERIKNFCREILLHQPQNNNVKVLGPAPAALLLLRGNYRYRFLLKAEKTTVLQNFIRTWFSAISQPSSIKIKIDIDPYSFS